MTTYTHTFSTEDTSSVIDEVFYNEDTEELYVKLFREDYYGEQVIAGYEDVPVENYTAMELINSSRLGGNDDASVGAYWNIFIKPNFTGIPTSDIVLEPAKQPEDSNTSFFTSSTKAVEVEKAQGTEEVPVVSGEALQWILSYDSTEVEGEIAVNANNLNDALERFEQIAQIAGLEGAYVTSAKVDFV